jgi:dihydrofolate reductase
MDTSAASTSCFARATTRRSHKEKIKMRKIKLQFAHLPEGFAPTANSEPLNYCDEEFRNFSIANLEQVDCIILGRKTALDFIPYWAAVAENPNDPDFQLGKKLTDTPKVVFSTTLENSEWANTILAKGEIVDEINKLKNQAGHDIMVYGGDSFVSSLIKNDLIDEYYLAVNPVDIQSGLPILKELDSKQTITLVESKTFDCGMVVLRQYEPKKK